MQLKKVASNTGTDDILRFNILSRKAAELTSKGATKEEAMEYLLEEFSRIGKNLDIMLATRNKEIPQETSTADALGPTRESTIEAQINIREQSEDTSTVQDPVSIKKKGRPEKPKRWKARVEQEREKAKKQQQKKTKKAETSSKEVLENFEIDVTKK